MGNTSAAKPQPTEPTPEPGHETKEPLADALDNKYVQIAICGTGFSTGESIIMAIRSLVDHSMKLPLTSGTLLRSSDPSSQDMVVSRIESERDASGDEELLHTCEDAADALEKSTEVQDEISASAGWSLAHFIDLPASQTQLYLISAYCVDFEKHNPASSTSFAIAEPRDSETTMLMSYVTQKSKRFSTVAVQLATWAINGNIAGSEIKVHFPLMNRNDRRRATC